MISSLSAVDASLAVFGLYLLKRLVESKPPAPYPPGPKGLPIIGNLHQYPQQQEWKTFYDWAEQYGMPDFVEPDYCLTEASARRRPDHGQPPRSADAHH
jgi:hypothetical protein